MTGMEEEERRKRERERGMGEGAAELGVWEESGM